MEENHRENQIVSRTHKPFSFIKLKTDAFFEITNSVHYMELNIAYERWFKNKKCSDLKEAQGGTLPMLTIPTSLSSQIILHVVVDFSVQW